MPAAGTPMSHYDTLGVGRGVTADEIRRAYRKLAFELHPDRATSSAQGAEQFKLISAAYATLSDPAARAVYDEQARLAASCEFSRYFGGDELVPDAFRARALFPFDARSENELSFAAGDTLVVSFRGRMAPPGWVHAVLLHHAGWVPRDGYLVPISGHAESSEMRGQCAAGGCASASAPCAAPSRVRAEEHAPQAAEALSEQYERARAEARESARTAPMPPPGAALPPPLRLPSDNAVVVVFRCGACNRANRAPLAACAHAADCGACGERTRVPVDPAALMVIYRCGGCLQPFFVGRQPRVRGEVAVCAACGARSALPQEEDVRAVLDAHAARTPEDRRADVRHDR
ncbi:hypothetical protein KFE25_011726 [Diacronema lutheri]|uniref:J domain-containing protein n=1 Tax=Diacronema lutheri TaxID=2081491 RepID=A0A8J6C5J6_DIALT|nr:hypothetical protein KFE25_011726 [Diacronema lutheri]